MNKIIFMETDDWKGKILLSENGYFEGVLFNEDSDITTDLISGIYSVNTGEIHFDTVKSKHNYVLCDKDLIDGYYKTISTTNDSGIFEGTCTDQFGRITRVALSMYLHEIEDAEISSEIDDLRLLINRTKQETFSKTPKLRIIK